MASSLFADDPNLQGWRCGALPTGLSLPLFELLNPCRGRADGATRIKEIVVVEVVSFVHAVQRALTLIPLEFSALHQRQVRGLPLRMCPCRRALEPGLGLGHGGPVSLCDGRGHAAVLHSRLAHVGGVGLVDLGRRDCEFLGWHPLGLGHARWHARHRPYGVGRHPQLAGLTGHLARRPLKSRGADAQPARLLCRGLLGPPHHGPGGLAADAGCAHGGGWVEFGDGELG